METPSIERKTLERFQLSGKVVVLTGGAGLYGRGLATDIASAGATLVIASRNLEACQKVAEEESSLGRQVVAESFDQGDEDSIQALRDRVLDRFGRIDGLVNNSVLRSMQSGVIDRAAWEASMRVNATGVYLMHEHFGRTMAEAGEGSIVNVGSIYGVVGPSLFLYEGTNMGSGCPDYYYNKSGMINMSRFYAAQYGRKGVRVNCVSPGGFFNNQPEPFLSRYCAQTFLGRMGNEVDLGGPVVFLLSDAASYVTGTNIPVDGGFTAH